jgi:hypothetical protein
MVTETSPTPNRGRQTVQAPRQSQWAESMSGSGYLKFRNDRGVPEICIGVREFKCIGHPHRKITRTSTCDPTAMSWPISSPITISVMV